MKSSGSTRDDHPSFFAFGSQGWPPADHRQTHHALFADFADGCAIQHQMAACFQPVVLAIARGHRVITQGRQQPHAQPGRPPLV